MTFIHKQVIKKSVLLSIILIGVLLDLALIVAIFHNYENQSFAKSVNASLNENGFDVHEIRYYIGTTSQPQDKCKVDVVSRIASEEDEILNYIEDSPSDLDLPFNRNGEVEFFLYSNHTWYLVDKNGKHALFYHSISDTYLFSDRNGENRFLTKNEIHQLVSVLPNRYLDSSKIFHVVRFSDQSSSQVDLFDFRCQSRYEKLRSIFGF